ncbi:hypothetical protein [Planobispora longispora]|uniref:Uncharacterized protein n=1 Tax=Planobispora longispora TaxID=28887 RepID=A0A8J3W6D1_9ACTN|nr:hypothetical protein [Planobispora longispora]GIH76711.1 hypothetical protein Plo01_31400 [Planobispora longispora]
MATTVSLPPKISLSTLNGRHHKPALMFYLAIVIGHWAEHVVQAVQVYVWGWPLSEARGVLGIPFPWLVTSEWMHYGYALIMLVGLIMLRKGFAGRSRTWWNISLGIQAWHHLEHLLLLLQKLSGLYLMGKPAPTSLLQLVLPRMELHLFYNALVFVPMVVAMLLHRSSEHGAGASCTCAVAPRS